MVQFTGPENFSIESSDFLNSALLPGVFKGAKHFIFYIMLPSKNIRVWQNMKNGGQARVASSSPLTLTSSCGVNSSFVKKIEKTRISNSENILKSPSIEAWNRNFQSQKAENFLPDNC